MDVRSLLPKNKFDVEGATKLVALGYPAVSPVLGDLMGWLQDGNWPIYRVIAPFIAKIGSPVVSEVQRVLNSSDDSWKYWVLTDVVANSTEVANAVVPELNRISAKPTPGETAEGVDRIAGRILAVIERKHAG